MLLRDRYQYRPLTQKTYSVFSSLASDLDNLVNNMNLGCSQFSSQRKYVISESMLSSGSFGHVWMARNVADHSLSVLKRIRIVTHLFQIINPRKKESKASFLLVEKFSWELFFEELKESLSRLSFFFALSQIQGMFSSRNGTAHESKPLFT